MGAGQQGGKPLRFIVRHERETVWACLQGSHGRGDLYPPPLRYFALEAHEACYSRVGRNRTRASSTIAKGGSPPEEVPLNSPGDHGAKRVRHFRFTQPGLQSGFIGHPLLGELARELEVLLASRNVL